MLVARREVEELPAEELKELVKRRFIENLSEEERKELSHISVEMCPHKNAIVVSARLSSMEDIDAIVYLRGVRNKTVSQHLDWTSTTYVLRCGCRVEKFVHVDSGVSISLEEKEEK